MLHGLTLMTTIDDVARRAGVSPTTVSKFLNNRPYVRAETRAQIERAIADLQYVPSQRARNLSKRRSSICGLFIPYTPDQLFSDPHLLECMRGIEDEANNHDYNVLLSTARAPHDSFSACVRLLQSEVIDGAIVLETADLQPLPDTLRHKQAPMVVIGYASDSALPAVHADDYGGAMQALNHLIDLGHRRIAVISSTLRPFAVEERLRGVHDALAAADLALDDHLLALGDFSIESGEHAASALLAQPERPTAIFALNDRMALGAMRAAAALGIHVPDDLSVVGFDDIALAALTTPALTTVRQSGFALGQAAAHALFAALDGTASPPNRVIETELVLRASTSLLGRERRT